MLWFLIASLAVNVLLALAGGRLLRRQSWREALVRAGLRRRTDADFVRAARALPPVDPGSTVFVGDSHFGDAPLLEMLTPYRNRAVGGAGTAHVLAWIDRVLAGRPGHVVLWIAGNDAYRGIPPEQSRADLERVLDRIASVAACRVTLMAAPPLVGHEEAIAGTNAMLAAVAAERSCGWVDVTPLLAGTAWTSDGIHLTRDAYLRVAPLLREAVAVE